MIKLIFKEIAHRKINFLFSIVAVFTAVTLFVAFVTSGSAFQRETRKIMLNLGQNLRIIPKETRLDDFWSTGFSQTTMPQEYLDRFTKYRGFSFTHLTATLQKKIRWKDKTVILTGILPEVFPPDKSFQKPMTFSVKPGQVYIGYEIAESLSIQKNQTIELMGNSFKVVEILAPSGSQDDIKIYGNLEDVQRLLNLEGQINEIRALECLCIIETGGNKVNPRILAQQQLEELLPEGQVLMLQGIADIRQKQRAASQGYISFIMPIIIVVCGAWVGVLAMMNVRERKQEIGLLRALGYNSYRISGIFLGKSFLIGLIAALLGFYAGTQLALWIGPDIFPISAKSMKPDYNWLLFSLLAAPVFSVISGFIPMAIAITQDPAISLRQD